MTMTAQALWITAQGDLVELEDTGATALHDAVGGWFEAVDLTPNLTMWLNEEGKLMRLPHNLKGQAIWDSFFGEGTDYIVGNIVLTGGTDEEGGTLPLSAEDLAKLSTALA